MLLRMTTCAVFHLLCVPPFLYPFISNKWTDSMAWLLQIINRNAGILKIIISGFVVVVIYPNVVKLNFMMVLLQFFKGLLCIFHSDSTNLHSYNSLHSTYLPTLGIFTLLKQAVLMCEVLSHYCLIKHQLLYMICIS